MTKDYESTELEMIEVRGKLRVKSVFDADKYLILTLIGGWLGLHKLYVKSYGAFVLYLLTGAFFGVCWMFDLIEIYFGIAKDKSGAYIGTGQITRTLILIPITVYAVLILVFCKLK